MFFVTKKKKKKGAEDPELWYLHYRRDKFSIENSLLSRHPKTKLLDF